MLKRIWNDPVWSKVLAGAILAALGLLGTYLFNWWHYISDFAQQIYNFIAYLWRLKSETATVTNWILLTIVLLALPTIFRIFVALISLFRTPPQKELTWRDYTEDIFFNIRWRWRYINNQITDLHSFCMHCDFQIFPQRTDRFDDSIHFDCESCSSHLQTFDETYSQVESKILRFIDQKHRNNKWREVVEIQLAEKSRPT